MPVPRLWPGATVVCVGSGPSLLPGDVEQCRDVTRVIAINDAYRLAPWADVLYAADAEWWRRHRDGVRACPSLKYRVRPDPAGPRGADHAACAAFAADFPDVHLLHHAGHDGLSTDPGTLAVGLRGGQNSGYQAINLAVHLGAARILLLGYDMQDGPDGQAHWFGAHAWRASTPSPYRMMQRSFDGLLEPLQRLGVDVINCSRRTALTQFQRLPIERVLASDRVAA